LQKQKNKACCYGWK